MNFGFYPRPLDLTAGDVKIETLADLEETARAVLENEGVKGDWIYAPPQQVQDIVSGETRVMPYSSRIFGLPHAHAISHLTSNDPERLKFLIWMLGFIVGMRLTETEAGFLDATPVKPGVLHDIVWEGDSRSKAIATADGFWQKHSATPRITTGLTGIVNSLFFSQSPRLLEFESFIYNYVAIDGCYAVWTAIHGEPKKKPSHAGRIAYLCSQLGRPIPDWVVKDKISDTVPKNRNDALHEGLFYDEPLGFQVYGGNSMAAAHDRNVLLEMRCLVCRLICGIVGFNDHAYITSDLGTRSKMGVRL